MEEICNKETTSKIEATSVWKYWNEFVEKYGRLGRSQSTIGNAKDVLKFVARVLKIETIEECNNNRLLEDKLFEAKNTRHFGNVTYNSYLKNLNTYFRWLEKQGYITENNIKKIYRCKEEQNEQLTLTKEQVRSIVGQIHTRRQSELQRTRNALFIDLLRLTGSRPCELLNIQIGDIRNEGPSYKLVIKGKKQKGRIRYYQLSSCAKDSYKTYMQKRATLKRHNEPYLFISSSKQGRWTEKGMRNLFRKLSTELGFKITAYGFRRFVATYLNEQGTDMKDIQNYLGHTRVTTTQRYIEKSCVLTRKAGEIMGKM